MNSMKNAENTKKQIIFLKDFLKAVYPQAMREIRSAK